MEDDKQYGIAETLSEALEAAVFADSSASNKAYDMIERYAYGVDPDDDSGDDDGSGTMKRMLDMAVFTITGADGKLREVSIPKITMIPLPMLHVTEATFNIEMTANIENVRTTEGQMNPSSSALETTRAASTPGTIPTRRPAATTTTRPRPAADTQTPSTTVSRPTSDSITRTATGAVRRVTTPMQRRRVLERGIQSTSASATNQRMVVVRSSTSTKQESNTSTIHMRVKVEMKQAELPEGIKLLLQAAANSLQVAASEITGKQ